MRIWLELTQEEGEKLFELVKGFSVDRAKTAVISSPDNKAGINDIKEVHENQEKEEEAQKVTKEMIRAVLTEKKLQGKALKGLFAKFGAVNLSGVKEEDYPALLKDAEAI